MYYSASVSANGRRGNWPAYQPAFLTMRARALGEWCRNDRYFLLSKSYNPFSLGGSMATRNDAVRDDDRAAGTARRPLDLIAPEKLKQLQRRTDIHGSSYFIVHFALIGVGAWLTWIAYATVWFAPVLLAHAFVIGFLFSPLHECAHGTAFKSRWLNETALWITAFVYVVPPYYFRYFHLGHHRFTQIPGKDPSLVLPEPASFRQYLWYCAGLWFWWRNITWMLKHFFGHVDPASAEYVPKSRIGLMIVEARILVPAYAILLAAGFYFGFAWQLFICWLLPRFLGEPVQRIIRVAEHVGCAETPDLLKNTRTTITNAFVNAIAWQMPFHAEHHLYPNVPFHALPALHRVVGQNVVIEGRGYLAGQKDIIRNLLARKAGAINSAQGPKPLL